MRYKLTQEQFLLKAKAVHGEAYSYTEAQYEQSNTKVKITCPTHGLFLQTANSHLAGIGCKKCGLGQIGKMHNTVSFIAKAQSVHGIGCYDYTQVVYSSNNQNVSIICPAHGLFMQKPRTHTSGTSGCPKCGQLLKTIHRKLGWLAQAAGKTCTLYFLRFFNENEEFYKVGITYNLVKERYKSPKQRGGYNYEILALHASNNPQRVYDWEDSILETFSHLQYRPRTHFIGETECFTSCDEILAIFPL